MECSCRWSNGGGRNIHKGALGSIAIGLLLIGGYTAWSVASKPDARTTSQSVAGGDALVEIVVPASLSEQAEVGKRSFEQNCVACHGENAVGRDGLGPPLVHIIYEPNHHADESFQRAVALGVRSHHWSFGNMSAVEGLVRNDVAYIIAYVRELQRANGID